MPGAIGVPSGRVGRDREKRSDERWTEVGMGKVLVPQAHCF